MRIFFRVLFIFPAILGCYRISAQNYPVYNSYYVNPYLYNPAEAATENTWVFLNHRQQWTGVEGSPVLTTVNFNTLLNETHAGIGAKISSYQRGLLNTTDFTLSYAYGISVSKTNTLFFGLSGGAISSSIDVDKLSPSDFLDPVIASYLDNNMQPVANFGMLFRADNGINLGVSLPQLFAPKFNSTSSFSSTSVSPLDNVIISAYYKKKVEGKIVTKKSKGVRKRVKSNDTYAPLEFYLMYKYAKAGNSQFEVMGKFNLSENFWLGATYRQAYGFAGNMGISYEKILLAYSYELPGQPESGFSKGTHEIQLGIRLGEPKKFKHIAPTFRSSLNAQNTQHTARFQQTVEDPDNIQTQDQSKKKYYVVVKAFADFTSADTFKKKLIEQKYNADILYYAKEKKYYVHVLESDKAGDANEEARNLKNYSKLKDARVLVITGTNK